MRKIRIVNLCAIPVIVALGGSAESVAQNAGPVNCSDEAGLHFICGPKEPEDIAILPGGHWIITSGSDGLNLIDTRAKAWRLLTSAVDAKFDSPFPSCVTPVDPNRLRTQGLRLVSGVIGPARLYVVGHGDREAIEVFDVYMDSPEPKIAWRGCVRAPGTLEFNSVVAASDGTILATVSTLPGTNITDAFEGKKTGAVLEWRPGAESFRQIAGTDLPFNNGIEISADGKTVYVVSSGSRAVTAFRRDKGWHMLWTTSTPDIIPDNVHWGSSRNLFVTGMTDDEPACGGPLKVVHGKLDLMGCSRGYRVVSIDPKSHAATIVAKGARTSDFIGATTALPSAGTLWIGSFYGNRLSYRPWP